MVFVQKRLSPRSVLSRRVIASLIKMRPSLRGRTLLFGLSFHSTGRLMTEWLRSLASVRTSRSNENPLICVLEKISCAECLRKALKPHWVSGTSLNPMARVKRLIRFPPRWRRKGCLTILLWACFRFPIRMSMVGDFSKESR